MNITPIKTQHHYRSALKEIDGLMTAKRNTPEGDRLDVLVTLVEAWERKHYRFDLRILRRQSSIIWTRMGFDHAACTATFDTAGRAFKFSAATPAPSCQPVQCSTCDPIPPIPPTENGLQLYRSFSHSFPEKLQAAMY
jgi:hypothetical protein